MATSENTADLDDEEFARHIISKLSHSPLIVDVMNEVRKHRRLGIPDEKIEQIIKSSLEITEAGYETTDMEDKEIVVTNLPSDYNKLDWT